MTLLLFELVAFLVEKFNVVMNAKRCVNEKLVGNRVDIS